LLRRYERRPPGYEFSEDRPRIATEENRLAQIAKFKRELSEAKAGHAAQRGEERLPNFTQHYPIQGSLPTTMFKRELFGGQGGARGAAR
jgi:hypothetical protein